MPDRVQRNAKCPCGSGKKSKKCCQSKSQVPLSSKTFKVQTNSKSLQAAAKVLGAAQGHLFQHPPKAAPDENPSTDV